MKGALNILFAVHLVLLPVCAVVASSHDAQEHDTTTSYRRNLRRSLHGVNNNFQNNNDASSSSSSGIFIAIDHAIEEAVHDISSRLFYNDELRPSNPHQEYVVFFDTEEDKSGLDFEDDEEKLDIVDQDDYYPENDRSDDSKFAENDDYNSNHSDRRIARPVSRRHSGSHRRHPPKISNKLADPKNVRGDRELFLWPFEKKKKASGGSASGMTGSKGSSSFKV